MDSVNNIINLMLNCTLPAEEMCTKCGGPASTHTLFGRELIEPELWHGLTGISERP